MFMDVSLVMDPIINHISIKLVLCRQTLLLNTGPRILQRISHLNHRSISSCAQEIVQRSKA
ncbi:unnamed protein product [Nezara viridula]|uniref:Uncharacterized protein n=1 Tax=Nezara viridula TaxID=85310 RepID=A0A9P0HSR6_NEZVI|nr:unnamed protein product [Nezara viridula]